LLSFILFFCFSLKEKGSREPFCPSATLPSFIYIYIYIYIILLENDKTTTLSQLPHNLHSQWCRAHVCGLHTIVSGVVKELCKGVVSQTCPNFIWRNDPYTHFSQQSHNKLMWLVKFYYFFTKRKQNKKNNKILPATSACCGAVVRNECRDYFSFI
jgi:hypothetical protein